MVYERKIINDPVFGFINIPKGLLYDIVRHPLLQRLTRIKQVGLSSVVYPGAQHTRFQHSLGAFYLMSEAITQLASKGNFIFDSEAEAVQAAILLHDIGHGPFSHLSLIHIFTIPYKEQVIPFLDELDRDTAKIGAVNVIKIIRQPKCKVKLVGYNSDIIGFTPVSYTHLHFASRPSAPRRK